MEVSWFETVVVGRRTGGGIVIACINGSQPGERCVAILACQPTAAKALRKALGSALKEPIPQADDDD